MTLKVKGLPTPLLTPLGLANGHLIRQTTTRPLAHAQGGMGWDFRRRRRLARRKAAWLRVNRPELVAVPTTGGRPQRYA